MFRMDALLAVAASFQQPAASAAEFLQRDLGEDRFLCTLLIRAGATRVGCFDLQRPLRRFACLSLSEQLFYFLCYALISPFPTLGWYLTYSAEAVVSTKCPADFWEYFNQQRCVSTALLCFSKLLQQL